MAVAFAVVLTFFFGWIPSGHDFEFHMNSWINVLGQWKQGLIYPRWAGLAHYGYGEARFIFYPPTSWTMGAMLGALLPWTMVPAAYTWIALTLSGCSMFLWCREWLSRRDAIFAAVFYTANPYYLIIVFWRSAFAELLAGALLPLVVLFLWRASEGRRAVLPLAFIVCTAWLTDVPAAVMLTYSLVPLASAFSFRKRSARIGLVGVSAIALGAGLAAFYLLPAIYEQQWVNIDQVLAPGVRAVDNFLFTRIGASDHDRFNLFVSLIAFSEIVVLGGTIVLSRIRGRLNLRPGVMVWGVTCVLLMLPMTVTAWKYFPELKFVQLPWRWLLCLNVPLAFYLTIAWRHWATRLLACAVFLAVVAYAGHRVQPPWWDHDADVHQMVADQRTGRGYEGTDEYVPSATDGYDITRNAPLVAAEEGGAAQVQVQQWNAQLKRFTVTAGLPTRIDLRLFNYPAWQARVNGNVTATETLDVTGQMVIPIQAGMNQVTVIFTRTWDRTAGMIISLITGLLVIGIALYSRNKTFVPTAQ